MRTIELDIDRLVGYAIVGSDEKRIEKLGSAKIGGKKMNTATPGELTASTDGASAAS